MKIFRDILDPLFGVGITAMFFAEEEGEEDSGGGSVAVEEGTTKKEISDELISDMEEFDKKASEEEEDEEAEAEEDDEKKEDDDDIEIEGDDEDSADEDDNAEDDDSSEEKADDDEDKPVISDELLARAEKLGLDADEAKAFKNPKTLEKILDALAPKETQQTTEPPVSNNSLKYELKFDESFDPEFTEEVTKMNDHYAKVAEQQSQRLNVVLDELYTTKFDGLIGNLDEGWQKVFGKGSKDELSSSSKEFKNRIRLDEEINTIQAGRIKLGKQPLSLREAFDKAMNSEFHGELQKIKDGLDSKNAKKNKRRTLARGSRQTRSSKPLTGYEAAVEYQHEFDNKLKEEGYS